jgi:toxin FitB
LKFLLDTNVISEWVKPQPHPGVIRWLNEAYEDHIFISVISIAEVRRGIERMPKGQRRDGIAAWLHDDSPLRFAGRILPVDLAVAQQWGVAIESARSRGFNIGIMDGFLAATARDREPLFNPWADNPWADNPWADNPWAE